MRRQEKRKERQVAVRFELDLLEKIEKHAKKEGRPIASFIRYVMQQEIERREKEELSLSMEEWDTLKGMVERVLGSPEQKRSIPSKATAADDFVEFMKLLRRLLR